MAESTPYAKPHKQIPDQIHPNQSKFLSNFLYKSVIITLFLVIIPLFPSQAPDFVNQTLLTRSWELLHLLFVGIAVSYGLFSRRSDDSIEKESNHSKFDNAQSYVSKFLQVSSVFDDDSEILLSGSDENKVQTWSNQYYRNEPVVVVAKEHPVVDQQRKPLLLPVRSLKSRVSDVDGVEFGNDSSSVVRSRSRRSSNNLSASRNGVLEEKLKGNDVLPSPIPWRSRSGRFEMKEDLDGYPMEDSRSFKSQMSWSSSRSNSSSSSPNLSPSPSFSSPKKLTPSPSLSLESQGKNAEDLVRKKGSHKSSSAPPPPPPPPPKIHKLSSLKPSDRQRSIVCEPEDVEMKPRSYIDGSTMGKSVRTIRPGEVLAGSREIGDDGINVKAERKQREIETTLMEPSARRNTGLPKTTFSEFPRKDKKEFVGKVIMESEEDSENEYEDDEEDDVVVIPQTDNKEVAPSSASDGGPDVDKKAEEFIAKFREQIRLQRTESKKRSSGAQMP